MGILTTPKDPDTPTPYEINIFEEFIDPARRSELFALADLVRFPRDTGFYYECSKAGRTAANYPDALPRSANRTVIDGSAEWTAKHPSDVSPVVVQSVTWIMPTGLTLDSQSQSNHVAQAVISGGTDGQDYDVTARITPDAGNPRDVTITIPVRHL